MSNTTLYKSTSFNLKMDIKALVTRLKRTHRSNKYKMKQMHDTEQKTNARYLKRKTFKDKNSSGEVTETTKDNPQKCNNISDETFNNY